MTAPAIKPLTFFQSVWGSFVAIFRKEFLHIIRDRQTLVTALSIPIFQLMLFGFIDQTVKDLPTIVVDQDGSRESRDLMDEMRASRTFAITEVTRSIEYGRQRITAGRARVGVVIPPDYHDKRLDPARTGGGKILVLIDGSDSTASAQALASMNGLAAQYNLQYSSEQLQKSGQKINSALAVQPIILFNPDGRTANYIIPGLIAVMLQIVATVLTALAIVRERERGTFEQLLVTPVHPLGLMLGKLAPYLVICEAEVAIILFVMRWMFEVPIRGSLVFLFTLSIVYVFALLAMGLFISTSASSQAEAQQRAQMFLLPSIFLSGYIFPSSGLPWPLYWIGRFLPATHMVEIMRGIILRNAGPLDLWRNVAALLAISVVLVTLSVRRFRKVAS
ncbi:MAG: ABC transporter permease [Polyangiales bacterium]